MWAGTVVMMDLRLPTRPPPTTSTTRLPPPLPAHTPPPALSPALLYTHNRLKVEPRHSSSLVRSTFSERKFTVFVGH